MRLGFVAASQSGALLAALEAMALSTSANAKVVRAAHKVYYMGVPVAVVRSHFDVSKDRYRATLDGQVQGAASLGSNYTIKMETIGAIQNGLYIAQSFTTTTNSSAGAQQARLRLKSGDVIASTIEPPLKDLSERVPIGDQDLKAIMDPLSAVLEITSKPANGAGASLCNKSYPLHFGTRRPVLVIRPDRDVENAGLSRAGHALRRAVLAGFRLFIQIVSDAVREKE